MFVRYGSAVFVERAVQHAKKRKHRKNGDCFRFEPVAMKAKAVYGEPTAAFLFEICRRITEATGKSREIFDRANVWFSGAARHALSVLTVFVDSGNKNTMSSLGPRSLVLSVRVSQSVF